MFGRRPAISRSRSTPRLNRSGSGRGYDSGFNAGRKSRVDNTFQCDHGLGSRPQLRHCHSYVQELGRLRQGAEFEATNQKRLMRKEYFEKEKDKIAEPR